MGKEIQRNNQKNAVLDDVAKYLSEKYDTDVQRVSTSEVMMPAVDDDGNEFYYIIKISVPRGKRNGEGSYEPYNGYEAAQEYQELMEMKEEEKRTAAAAKADKEKQKQRKKEAKKIIKALNTEGFKALIHKTEDAE